jgi:alanine-synthesizing transaminase
VRFHRIDALPQYVFASVDQLKRELRREGRDVIDLGFGNPDLPPPALAVEKLREAALNPRNHRYSASRGIESLRLAAAEHYQRRFGVTLDPETQIVSTIGAKEGLTHLLWTLVDRDDTVVVPTPAYPIHQVAPRLAGATVVTARADGGIDAIEEAMLASRPRVVVVSYPHNPTTAVTTAADLQRLVDLALEHDVLLVHDFAYADVAFDGHEPPSILAAAGADRCAVELYSLTKSYSLAGWRLGFVLGNAEVVAALAKLKSYLDYGTFQPIQIAATVTLREAHGYSTELCEQYRRRRDTLCAGLERAGWVVEPPRGTMFVWAQLPERLRAEGSLSFALRLAREAHVAVSPGVGFGDGGEGHVRFALVENEQRIAQAARQIRRFLEADTLYSEAWPRSGSHPSSAPTQRVSARSSSTPRR